MTEPTTSDIEALPEKIAHPVAAFPQNELVETVHASCMRIETQFGGDSRTGLIRVPSACDRSRFGPELLNGI